MAVISGRHCNLPRSTRPSGAWGGGGTVRQDWSTSPAVR